MKLKIIFFAFCLLTCVSGDCDTHRFATPNLKFLKILTEDSFQVRKSDRGVREGQEVYLYCSNKTLLSDEKILSKALCENNKFENDLPECRLSCEEPVFDVSTTTIECTKSDCNRRQVVGTEIEITCKPGFKFPKNGKQLITCFDDGWDYPLYSCGKYNDQKKQTEFGTDRDEIKDTFSFEDHVSNDIAPWHVWIYQRLQDSKGQLSYRCSGSLVSPTLVATAAKCFSVNKRGFLSKHEYVVKHHEKIYNIDHIEIADGYEPLEILDPSISLKNDFAIAVLDRPVENPITVYMTTDPSIYSFGTKGMIANCMKSEKGFFLKNLTIKQCIHNDCYKSNSSFTEKPSYSRNVFCSTNKQNNFEDCRGYIGSGLIVIKNDKQYLAGVLSAAEGSDMVFSDATNYCDVYEKACDYETKNTKFNPSKQSSSRPTPDIANAQKDLSLNPSNDAQQNPCPGSEVVCGERCIAIEYLCTDKCKNIPYEDQCKFRATHQMQITGLNLLKFIGNLDQFKPGTFPNWIVPTASLWSLFSFLSKASDRNISQQLQYDFGVTPDLNVNEDFRKLIDNAHIVSSASYTNADISKKLLEAHFRRVFENERRYNWFYSTTEDRVTGIYDYDFKHSFQYRGEKLVFMMSETENVKTTMICSDTDFKLLKWDRFADVIDVAINGTVRLMMIKPKDLRESLFDVMSALKRWPIRDLLKLPKVRENDGFCFPRFKTLMEADYSPILFKMGYDYLFTPTRVNLENIKATNVRVQTQVRAFIKIWDADNDYGELTSPYEEEISNYYLVDQPFVFILYDNQTNLPWLVGRVNNPKMIHYYTSYASRYNMFP